LPTTRSPFVFLKAKFQPIIIGWNGAILGIGNTRNFCVTATREIGWNHTIIAVAEIFRYRLGFSDIGWSLWLVFDFPNFRCLRFCFSLRRHTNVFPFSHENIFIF
jgi:hypothetical protein